MRSGQGRAERSAAIVSEKVMYIVLAAIKDTLSAEGAEEKAKSTV